MKTKKEFAKEIKIYKSHKLANNLISVTYADCLNETTVSVSKTVVVDDKGGALNSLYYDKIILEL